MKILSYIILVAVLVSGCAQTVPLSKYEKLKVEHQKVLALLQLAEMESNLTLLETLRENKTESAIESLESFLDVDITGINENYFDKFETDQRFNKYFSEQYLTAIERAQKYRLEHPRSINESVYAITSKKHDPSGANVILEMAKDSKVEAETVLQELNSLSNQSLKRDK